MCFFIFFIIIYIRRITNNHIKASVVVDDFVELS